MNISKPNNQFMSYAVCTLFEKSLHYGVAALTNSLYRQGFRGDVYAAYRGNLPAWANKATKNESLQWEGGKTMQLGEGAQLHFLPLDTDYHFANYKPKFMIRLFEGPAKDAEGLFYFDPDIVIKCKWSFFEYWITFGVAMVHELISQDMHASHPIRLGWEQLIKDNNRTVTANIQSYLNSGFCGLTKNNIEFLKAWAEFIEVSFNGYGHERGRLKGLSRTTLYYCADQDAFNIAAMCCGCPVTEIGPDGMDFVHGGWVMSHATSRPKPWIKNFLQSALIGNPPRLPEQNYWKNVTYPIPLYSKGRVRFKVTCLKIATFMGRFYRRY
ncbi:MAG: hypothetical protein ABIS01_08195 [Ferruginibacter sp.]